MSAVATDPLVSEWLAKLPVSKEAGIAAGFDGRAWFAGYLKASAISRADAVYLALGGFIAGGEKTLDDLWGFVFDRGLVSLEAWASTMASLGADGEPWAREAANDFSTAYRDRIEALLETAAVGGAA